MAYLSGKRILITGLLSNRSIAYGIAKACHREGAELAFTYVGERFKDRITEFAKEFNSSLIFDSMWVVMNKSMHCLRSLANRGPNLMALSIPLDLHPVRQLPVIFWRA